MKHLQNLMLIFVFLFSTLIAAQNNNLKTIYAEGLMDGKMKVTMFGYTYINECTGEKNYMMMYKYDDLSNWLLLDVTSDEKNNLSLVEYYFTGLMILNETSKGFHGIWISPDAKRQLKVNFEKKKITETKKQELSEKLDNLNYEYNDC